MVEPSAKAAVDGKGLKTLGEPEFDGEHHIGIVLFRRIGHFLTNRVFPDFTGFYGVKITQGDIGTKSQTNQMVIAAVGSYDKVIFRKGDFAGGKFPGPEYIADRRIHDNLHSTRFLYSCSMILTASFI